MADNSSSTRNKRRNLDDAELDSGDDVNAEDCLTDDDMDVDENPQDKTFLEQNQTLVDMSMARHKVPHGSDREVCSTARRYLICYQR